MIFAETKFDARTSPTGALGLMQIEPTTAEFLARRSGATSFVLADLAHPTTNIAYGSYYLRYLLDRYGGSETLALAAYNGGETNVDGWLAQAHAAGVRFTVHAIPFAETRAVCPARRARAAGVPKRVRALAAPAPRRATVRGEDRSPRGGETPMSTRPPVPPFREETARQEGAGRRGHLEHAAIPNGSRSPTPSTPSGATGTSSSGREAIVEFLRRKWAVSSITGSARNSGASPATGSRCASSTSSRDAGRPVVAKPRQRALGVRRVRLMRRRDASINDYRIVPKERRIAI